jgi:hypothetical protein
VLLSSGVEAALEKALQIKDNTDLVRALPLLQES